ncbi:hypothetical protein AAFF_G00367090 [Aldrovandia affinis]|uniref:Uncharacterized protein n=1 Tax=Aldrovandia affinis TaxID=143900 RepID=A0AAD7WML6_9TELE|nr:hypothetical protein AAFF_G00367090 [Aldrovandia affinis]
MSGFGACGGGWRCGEEVAVPVALSPELFSPLSGTVAAESGEGATTPARKRASSGDHECPRGNKSAP